MQAYCSFCPSLDGGPAVCTDDHEHSICTRCLAKYAKFMGLPWRDGTKAWLCYECDHWWLSERTVCQCGEPLKAVIFTESPAAREPRCVTEAPTSPEGKAEGQ